MTELKVKIKIVENELLVCEQEIDITDKKQEEEYMKLKEKLLEFISNIAYESCGYEEENSEKINNQNEGESMELSNENNEESRNKVRNDKRLIEKENNNKTIEGLNNERIVEGENNDTIEVRKDSNGDDSDEQTEDQNEEDRESVEMLNEKNNEDKNESKEIIENTSNKKSKKRKRKDEESQEKIKKNRRNNNETSENNDLPEERSIEFRRLLKDLTTPVPDEWLTERMEDIRSKKDWTLNEVVIGMCKDNSYIVERGYLFGKIFRKELDEKLNNDKGSREQTKRAEIFRELAESYPQIRKSTIKKGFNRVERIYKIFKGIGKEKMKRMINTSKSDIINLEKDEVQLLIDEVNKENNGS